MIRRRTRKPTTRELLRSDCDLGTRRRNSSPWFWISLFLFAMGVVAGTTHHFSTNRLLEQCRASQMEEKEQLKTLLAGNMLRREQEKAMREELGRQVSEQAMEIKKLQEEVAFFRLMRK